MKAKQFMKTETFVILKCLYDCRSEGIKTHSLFVGLRTKIFYLGKNRAQKFLFN